METGHWTWVITRRWDWWTEGAGMVECENGDWTSVITSWLQFGSWDCWSEVTNVIGDRVVYLSSRKLSYLLKLCLTWLNWRNLTCQIIIWKNYQQASTSWKIWRGWHQRWTSWENLLKPLPSWVTWLCLVRFTTSCLFYLQGTEETVLE